MAIYQWNEVLREQMNPLLARRVIHSQSMSVAAIELRKGCVVPEHRHINEQVSMVQSGRVLFHVAGRDTVATAGVVIVLEADVPHSVEALEDSVVVDVFAPPREDWRRGDDAYLRK